MECTVLKSCFRYWECVNGQPELYDCPNGLVFAGKHRGVTEGCDYPWRANYCEDKQLASTCGRTRPSPCFLASTQITV